MQCLIVYDIVDDNKRNKIADVCQDYGLDRIQFSVFAGQLTSTHQNELMQKLKKVLGKRPGKVMLLPVNEKDWQNRQEVVIEAPTQAPSQESAAADQTPQPMRTAQSSPGA